MKCPYCEKEMKKGHVDAGDAFDVLFRFEKSVTVSATWVPEEEKKRMFTKNAVNVNCYGEGYYCKECGKVVAIFNERGDGFFGDKR